MLIFKLLVGCLVSIFSIHPILVLGASKKWSELHLLTQQSTPEALEPIQFVHDAFLNQTESHLRIAIKDNNCEAAECIIHETDRVEMFGKLIKKIYERNSPVIFDDQVSKSKDFKLAQLLSKKTISAIDLGYLLGLEGLIKFLVKWKLNISLILDDHPIEENKDEIMNVLLKKSLDMSYKNQDGENLLLAAIKFNNLELVELFLARNIKYRAENANNISLEQKTYYKTISNNALDLTIKDNYGQTPLHYACEFGTPRLVGLLLANPEVDVNVQDKSGKTPIMIASCSGKLDVVEYLLTRQDLITCLNDKDNNGNSLLHIACMKGQLKIVQQLVDKVDVNIENNYRYTPILVASLNRKWNVVEYLLIRRQALNINVDTKDGFGDTLLHMACGYGRLELVKQLLAIPKIDINVKNSRGNAPILSASKYKRWDVVSILLDRQDFDAGTKNRFDENLLHIACEYGRLELVKQLLANPKVDVNMQNENGFTPIMKASFYGKWDVVEYLLIWRQNLDVNIKEYRGDTLLHYACRGGSLETINRLLFDYKVDANAQIKFGDTPILEASRNEQWNVVEYLLIKRQDLNIDVDTKGSNGYTLLHTACMNGQLKIVQQLLVNYKANVNIQNNEGKTAMEVAKGKGFSDILRLFENHMSD